MIKHLAPRSTDELEQRERALLSGKSVQELTYDEVMELRLLIFREAGKRIVGMKEAKKSQFVKGQKVSFMARDGVHYGFIARRNKERANIIEYIPGTQTIRRWRVPYEHLSEIQ